MNSKKVYYLSVGSLVLLCISILLSTYYSVNLLQKESMKLVEVKLQNRIQDEQQVALKQATNNIKEFSELDRIARSIVPQDKDQAKAVREIVEIAKASNISLSTISFPASTLGQGKAKTNTTDSSTKTKTKQPSETQVKPVAGLKGVYNMEITIVQATDKPTDYVGLIKFLERLENNRRTAHVSDVTVIPDTKNRSKLTMSMILNVYIKP
jgi:hypothetical protein